LIFRSTTGRAAHPGAALAVVSRTFPCAFHIDCGAHRSLSRNCAKIGTTVMTAQNSRRIEGFRRGKNRFFASQSYDSDIGFNTKVRHVDA
jgi:hypothetical protein